MRSALDESGLHLALVDIPPSELRDPFLHETVNRLPHAITVVHTPAAQLGQVDPRATPHGVIFHMARCGSTLVSQMLKQHGGVVAYSEAQAVNELLVPPHAGSRAQRVAAIRTLGTAFAAHAGRPCVLKLSSWNTLFCELVADAFPQTPLALCIRDPIEIAVSLQQSMPSWLRDDGAMLFSGVVERASEARSLDERIARFLGAFFEASARLPVPRCLLLRYEELPNAAIDSLVPHFGLHLDDSIRQRMLSITQRHAKVKLDYERRFEPDGTLKRAAASANLSRAIDEFARPAYLRLLERFTATTRQAAGR